jgi:hypothetical protein
MSDDTEPVPDAIKRLVDQLRASRVPVPDGFFKPLLDQLRASRAARAALLADPNTHPTLRRMLEARQRSDDEMQLPTFDEQPTPKPTRTRQRKPTVANVIRQMQRAGVEIAGCEISPRDGTVKVVTGKPVGGGDPDDTTASQDPKWN